MANYDSTATYDSGIVYADPPVPQPIGRMTKKKVKLLLKRKSDPELSTFAQAHVTAVTGNPDFTTLLPSAADFAAVLSAYDTTLAAFNTAQAAAKLATTNKDTARLALESMLTARGNYVELTASAAADPAAVIEGAAFSARSDKSPSGMPAQVSNLSITAGDHEGELDLHWDPVHYARTYEVQMTLDPITGTSWVTQASVSKSRAAVLGLTSGSKMWARVRAVRAGSMRAVARAAR